MTVLEKADAPGGRAYVHRQDGFVFDAGPTVVTAPFLFEELWALCGRKMSDDIDMRPVTPFYRVRFEDGTHFDYTGDAAAMLGGRRVAVQVKRSPLARTPWPMRRAGAPAGSRSMDAGKVGAKFTEVAI